MSSWSSKGIMTKWALRVIWVSCLVAQVAAAHPQVEGTGLRLLVVGTEAEATDLRRQIVDGAVFEVLAREHSLDPSSAAGGYIGTFAIGDLRQEFQDALRGIGPGELSPVSSFGDGYLLLQSLRAEEKNIAAKEAGLRALRSRRFTEAQQFYEVAAEEAEIFGRTDFRLGESLADLAAIYNLQQSYREALPLYRQSMAIRWTRSSADALPDVAGMLEDFTTVLSLAYFKDEEFDHAWEDYETAITEMPLTEGLYRAMAGMLRVAELAEEAEMVMLRAVEAFPSSRLTRYALGQLSVPAKPAEALAEFEKANAIDEIAAGDPALDRFQRSYIFVRIGDMHTSLSQLDNALLAGRAALELDPSSVLAHRLLGQAYIQRDELENGLAEFERAISLDPGDASAHSGLAEVYLQMGQFAESVAAAETAVEINPTDYSTRYILARALIRIGMRDEGQAEMRSYQELQANAEESEHRERDVRATSKRASELLVGGQGREAIASLESAIKSYPNEAILRLHLGVAQRKLGLHQEAIGTFQTMVDLGLGDSMVHRNLALEYETSGETQARDQHQATFFQRIDSTLTELAN